MIIKPRTLVFYRNKECISLYIPENDFLESWEGRYRTANSSFVYVLDMNADGGFQ